MSLVIAPKVILVSKWYHEVCFSIETSTVRIRTEISNHEYHHIYYTKIKKSQIICSYYIHQAIIQAEIGQYVNFNLYDKDEARDDENLGRWDFHSQTNIHTHTHTHVNTQKLWYKYTNVPHIQFIQTQLEIGVKNYSNPNPSHLINTK